MQTLVLILWTIKEVQKKIFKFNKPSLAHSQVGFTLVELIVVIALIALITTLFFSRGNNYFRLSIDTAARKFAPMVKETYNQSILTGRIHRIVYDIEKNQYWVESGPKNLLLETKESKKNKSSIFSDDKEEKTSFVLEKSITSKKRSLPGGVIFDKIFTEQEDEPSSEGMVYTHFFPNGLTEQTVIHLTDSGGNKKTMATTALIGNIIVLNNHLTRSEVYEE